MLEGMKMFCNECGNELKEGAEFCTNCGTKAKKDEVERSDEILHTVVQSSGHNVTFSQAVRLYFQNYTNFKGRATRAEYWWAVLFNVLVNFIASLIQPVGSLLVLALLIPGLSVGVRRLHDVGKSGLYLLMSFIPLVGAVILIVQFCKGSDEDNQWGASTR